MKTFLTIALILTANAAASAEYCMVKRSGDGSAPEYCFKTLGQCESRVDTMSGWKCEKR